MVITAPHTGKGFAMKILVNAALALAVSAGSAFAAPISPGATAPAQPAAGVQSVDVVVRRPAVVERRVVVRPGPVVVRPAPVVVVPAPTVRRVVRTPCTTKVVRRTINGRIVTVRDRC
jgi:hypothetical protein